VKLLNKPGAEESGFISYLKWLLDESGNGRAAMANLRRGLGKPPGVAYEMDKYLLTKLPEKTSQRHEEAYYLVAALFARWHQGKDKADIAEQGNLGTSLQELVSRHAAAGTRRDEAEKRLEKRVNALLNAHRDDLPGHLRRVVSLLKSEDVPLNWAQLLTDIRHWDSERPSVQHDWSKGFWIPGK
jgi:CRISPR system Cascade subunit CasB